MATPTKMGAKALTLAQKRQRLDDDLKQIEKQIMDLEYTYLEETHYGNVIRGWDGYLQGKIKNFQTMRKPRIALKNRIFSMSSTTAPLPEIMKQQGM